MVSVECGSVRDKQEMRHLLVKNEAVRVEIMNNKLGKTSEGRYVDESYVVKV